MNKYKQANINRLSSVGFGLLELLLVLGVLAVLLLAAFVVYPKVKTTMVAQEEAKRYTTIRAKMTTLGNVNFYAFPDRASVIGGRILSENDLTAGWGGQINWLC